MTEHGEWRASYTRRLPPLWWVKRRIRVFRIWDGWHCTTTWGITAATRDRAATELLDYLREMKADALTDFDDLYVYGPDGQLVWEGRTRPPERHSAHQEIR